MNWLWFAVQNVLRNPRRSGVTVLITAVGSAAILIGGGFALYTYQGLRELAARDSGHLVVAQRDYFDQEEDVPLEHGLTGAETLRRQLEQQPRVRMALPRLLFSGLITNGDKSAIFSGTGVDPRGEFQMKGPFLTVAAGGVLSTRRVEGEDPQVMLGVGLARIFKAQVGDGLTLLATSADGTLNALDVRVQGLFSQGVPELDKRALYLAVPAAQQLLRTERVSELSVYLERTDDTDAMRAALGASLPDHALRTWRDTAFFYDAVRNLYNRIFGMLGTVIVLMVFFAVTNTVSMAVVERTREIGTLRAMGTLPGQVVRNFVLEAGVLALCGVLLGMLLAVGTSVLLLLTDVQMPPPPGRSQGYPLRVNVAPLLFAGTAGAMLLAAMVSAWLGSRGAARGSIVEALTHV